MVEDNAINQLIASKFLYKWGAEINFAENGVIGVDKVKNKRFDIYEMVNKLIIERLEAGVIPWQRPWKSSSAMPRNLVSKKVYRGFNFWYLLSFDFENPLFLTFNQVKQLGGGGGVSALESVFRQRAHSHVGLG